MKKILALAFSLMLIVSLAGCAAQEQPAVQTAPETTQAVRQTEAPALLEVEITEENWQEYFEQREAQWVQVTQQGSIMLREFGYGIFLKEEYVQQLAEAEVAFEMEADAVRYQVYGDLTTDNFIVREDTLHNEGKKQLTAQVEDLRGNTRIQPESDFHDAVAAFFTIEGEFGA